MPSPSLTLRRFYREAQALGIAPTALLPRTRALLAAYLRLRWLATAAVPSHALPSLEAVLTEVSSADAVRLSKAIGGARACLAAAAAGEALTPFALPGKHQALILAVALMEDARHAVASYPGAGATYAAILTNSYFQESPLPDEVFLDKLYLERSTFYQAKKEACALFGLVLCSRTGLRL